jgi:hypothetical protein
MTRRESAIISAFTGIHMGNFSAMHKYIEEIMERPVFTHEMTDKDTVNQIKEKARFDFMALCESVSE